MSHIYSSDLDVVVIRDDQVKEYRTRLEKITPTYENKKKFIDLSEQFKSAVVLKDSLSCSIKYFQQLKSYYDPHSLAKLYR